MNMNCATCKHWGDYSDAPTNIKVGKCNKVPMFWDSTEWKEVGEDYLRVLTDEENKAFVQDGSDYSAKLLTVADFGCVQHEQM
jgi:hypothetical protein